MIPARFVTEYPARCLDLLDSLEPTAREKGLVGSFSLLAAASLLTIPYERMQSRHPLHQSDTTRTLRTLERQRFIRAEFWPERGPEGWRFSRVMTNANDTFGWKDEGGHHPISDRAENTLSRRRCGEVLRVMRNALAHGNIIYLNERGLEAAGDQLTHLAFLSRYEESDEEKEKAESYRLLAVPELEFLRFIKAWAGWIAQLPVDASISDAA